MDIKELIGVTLGTCTLERIIGRGGMGAVFQAQQSRPVRTVAVKVLVPSSYELEQEQTFLERFRREADTVARLEHKNILPIYEYDEAMIDGERLAYLVMPYIRGGTLQQRIDEMKHRGEHFDLKLVASYISQIADALSYAHSLGIVHRDIKPGNLLFHQDGRLLLSDFGIVRLQTMPALTSVGSFLGTAEYASPEQISSTEIDFRSDIYSLGCILYELLTNSVPFPAPNPFAVLNRKLHEEVPSVRLLRPDLSAAVDAVVMKALAKNPADRFQTATMLAADFKAAIGLASSTSLRLNGDANNLDMTIPEQQWNGPSRGVAAPMGVPDSGNGSFFPSTTPVRSSVPLVGARQQQQHGPPGWQWPSQMQVQAQPPASPSLDEGLPSPDEDAAAQEEGEVTYHQSHRLIYYSVLLIGLLLQPIIFPLVMTDPTKANSTIAVVLGVLLGEGINLLVLAAIGFTGVLRQWSVRRFVYRTILLIVLAPILSGFFISFGNSHGAAYIPLGTYLVLLASNIFAVRQLSRVDAPRERLENHPVLWLPALAGALTGLLPLTIILFFVLATPFSLLHTSYPLLNVFGVVLIALVGVPTPGAVLAIRLSHKLSFPSLVRSSAIAGILMFPGALLLVVLWNLLFPNSTQFFAHLNQTWLAFLLFAFVLATIGALRGMLDAWIYQRLRHR